ncbi:adenylate/guanylate cyclase domain-containing protein [Phyllobacterium calauticae]|uniref:adenylate/guanylate cyclase domain-containing protein n=1 Tax=Phyllobacterium calauticae TaxID=2817027 RepID=UPI001CBD6BCF|nr:adenylate/guanylate cyclase domain-containing protein [Phyllobacterium calauticae]MBZ3694672.1 adenylate/guanylate cyclase domain-containing protein [Phyllobacterium calauticae]
MTITTIAPMLSERSLRRARLASGLIMLTFLTLHLTNHALNLISLAAAEEGRRWFLAIWRNPVGTTLFYGAAVTHVMLAMRALYLRRTFYMPVGEALQIILGLVIPLLIIDHVVGTRIRHELSNYYDSYEAIIRGFWITSPFNGVKQTLALIVIWCHGCIGIHFWLRYRQSYQSAAPVLLTVAILLPVLALLGFANTGRTIANMSPASGYGEFPSSGYQGHKNFNATRYASPAERAEVKQDEFLIKTGLYGAFGGGLALVVALRIRRRWRERATQIEIRYADGESVRVPLGFSVLEASRLGGIPHYAVCGGKGRCSTCRVQVLEGAETLPPPEPIEQTTLTRIGADYGVRLACQLHPTANISVAPLLVPSLESIVPAGSQQASPGREREIAILFCDIRSFTMLTEARLPYDIVFLLNRYFAIVGQAVERSGGRLDKFIGDGAMALFGLTGSAADGCKNALKAAAIIVKEIERLNNELAGELSMPLRVAIGIHTGPAIVGAMGYGAVKSLTAIGDTVNVASRLEAVAKEFDVTLVVSEPVVTLAASDTAGLEVRDVAIRGRALPLRVYIVPQESSIRFA